MQYDTEVPRKTWSLQQTLFMISPCQVSALVLDHGSIHAVHVETYNLSRCGFQVGRPNTNQLR